MSEKIIVTCPNCQTHFIAALSKLLSHGRKARCSKCGNGWLHNPNEAGSRSIPQDRPAISRRSEVARNYSPAFHSRPAQLAVAGMPDRTYTSSAPTTGIRFDQLLNAATSTAADKLSTLIPTGIFKGVFAAFIAACAAKFMSETYGIPAMLLALLFGLALHFIHEDERCRPGIEFAAKTILRFGVALLGFRISAQMLAGLGPSTIGWIFCAVVVTILFGLVGARLMSRGWRFGLLTGGAVAICGASAAMAIAAILPNNKNSEANLTFTVIAVTMLSTIAMVLYPVLLGYAGVSDQAAGLFVGATIHDVAQVVGAGYTISDEAGDVATVVKMLRVALLAPVVFAASLIIARYASLQSGTRPPLLPGFVVAFLAIATLNSTTALPPELLSLAEMASKWMLLVAVAAVGMKTSLTQITRVGSDAIVLIVAETIFLAGGFALAMMYMAHVMPI